jgi:hypothetical protein
MKRLRVHSESGEEQIIGFRNCTARLMAKHVADVKFLKIFSSHNILEKVDDEIPPARG